MRWHLGCQHGKVAILYLCIQASGVARANPNVPARVAPPQVESVAPIAPPDAGEGGPVIAPDLREVAPVKAEMAAGPIEIVKAKPVPRVVAGENRSAARVPAVLAQLLAHQISVDEAWQSGALNVDDLRYVFEDYLSTWGLFDERDDASLRRALMALLVQHDERLKDVKKLSPDIRLWLADYYWSVKDERMLSLAENILSEVKQPAVEGSIPAFLAAEKLAWYYRDLGQAEKAAQSWLRVKDYEPTNEWWVPDATMEAARLYDNARQTDLAQALRWRVASSDNPGLGLGAVREWLASEVKSGSWSSAIQKWRQQAKVHPLPPAINSTLLESEAYAAYEKADWTAAIVNGQKAIDAYQLLLPSFNGVVYRLLIMKLDEMMMWAGRWQKAPLWIDNANLPLQAAAHGDNDAIKRRIFVSSPQALELNLHCSDERVSFRVLPSDWSDEVRGKAGSNVPGGRIQGIDTNDILRFEQVVEVTVPPQVLAAALDSKAPVSLSLEAPSVPVQSLELVAVGKSNAGKSSNAVE